MRERVATAMHTVWANRCEEICRDVEYGSTSGISADMDKHRFIQIARSSSEPHLVVGIWHVRPIGSGEQEIMNERIFSPPVHKATLRAFYRILIDNVQRITWVSEALERAALE